MGILKFLCTAALAACVSSGVDALLAFPGAEGFGRESVGGRAGSVYHVTSLEYVEIRVFILPVVLGFDHQCIEADEFIHNKVILAPGPSAMPHRSPIASWSSTSGEPSILRRGSSSPRTSISQGRAPQET